MTRTLHIVSHTHWDREANPSPLTQPPRTSSFKEAEDGKGWIVRGCNTTDRSVDCTITPHLPFSGAALANMAEEPQTQLYSDGEGTISFQIPAHGVVTLRFNV